METVHPALAPAVTAAVATVAGPPASPAAAGLPTDLSGVADLLRTMLGQPQVPTGTAWRMSNYTSATRLDALEQLVAGLQNQLSAKFADFGPRLDLATAALTALQASDTAQATYLQFLDSKAALAEAATAANQQTVAAVQLRQQTDEAQLAMLAARLGADEAASMAAQQAGQQAQNAARLAQELAATANAKADALAASTLQLKAAADSAQATATAAQASYTALSARFRTVRMSTPAVAIGGTMTVDITWPVAFADANYNAVAEFEGLGLLGLSAVITNRTATGCRASSKNVLGMALLASQGTLTVTAIHDATP